MSFSTMYRANLHEALDRIDLAKLDQAIDWLREAREAGRCIFVFGNGGSASTASHFACDMVKGASFGGGARFRIMALTDSLPALTAYSNDVGYDCVFVEQLRSFAEPGDIVIGISGSGNSANVLRAIELANAAGCRSIGLTGCDGGRLAPLVQLDLRVPEAHMGRIEDAHLVICHMIAYSFMETGAAQA